MYNIAGHFKENCRFNAGHLALTALLLQSFIFQGTFAKEKSSGFDPSVRPNIVLILADDLGWSDLVCYGADLHETPCIDRLAAESLRFTSAYAMPVCSPSRAALLTGRHAARVHMTIWSEGSLSGPKNRKLLQAESCHDLPLSEITIAELLHNAGYLTASVGKWHLGNADHYPETQGFDINIGGTHWGAPHSYFWPYRGSGRFGPETRYVPHMEFGEPGEYLTDRLTDEALKVIDHAAEKKQPFFLYLAHHAPHTPIQAKEEDVEYFKAKLKSGKYQHPNPVYAAMVKSLDESVGRVLENLKKHGLDKNTIVIFTSDNGGFTLRDSGQPYPVTVNTPLRSGKGSLYEGGIRIPLIIHWPGVTTPGSICEEQVVLMDLFATLSSLAPLSDKNRDNVIDGINLLPLLRNPDSRTGRTALHFHYPHYYPTTTPVSAIRTGDWKLLEYFEDGRIELYNLADDLSETRDLSKTRPEKAAELLHQLHDWHKEVDAAMPTPNPAYRKSE